MGGNGRGLMVAPEVEAAARVIAAGIGCPIEMIWGGLNWSGASVSLRVLENHFLNMRGGCERFLDFFIPKLATYFKLTPVNVKLSEFKMADDVQQQTNAINLMLQGYLSRDSVIGEMQYDAKEEFEKIEGEHERLNMVTAKDNIAASHMNTVIQALEARAQVMLKYELDHLQVQLQIQDERERLQALNAHVRSLHEKGLATPLEFDQSAAILQSMDPKLSQMILTNWQQTMPNTVALLTQKLQASQRQSEISQQAAGSPDTANMPQVQPPQAPEPMQAPAQAPEKLPPRSPNAGI
jgi:hypothetical protein